MSETGLTPLFEQRGETTADRLVRYGKLQALGRLVKAEQDAIREELDAEANTIESVTGGAYNVKVPAVGQVYRTAPEPEPVVENAEMFAAWADDEGLLRAYDRVLRLRVLNEHDLAEAIMNLDLDDPDPQVLFAIADSAIVHEEVRVRDGVLDHLVSQGIVQRMQDGTLLTRDGEPLPGVVTKAKRRQLTVKITAKQDFDAMLRQAIPALSERSEA